MSFLEDEEYCDDCGELIDECSCAYENEDDGEEEEEDEWSV